MSIELDRPGGGVAAFMLSVGTLLALEKNGTLVHDELADMRDATRTSARHSISLPCRLAALRNCLQTVAIIAV